MKKIGFLAKYRARMTDARINQILEWSSKIVWAVAVVLGLYGTMVAIMWIATKIVS